MKFKIKIGEREYEIEILEEKEGVKVKVGQKEFFFKERKKEVPAQYFFPKRDFKKKEVLAPISGIISEIFVKEGDFVKEGQKLLILSAMKMENEILAEFEGKVKEILVKEGQEVKEKETLIILE